MKQIMLRSKQKNEVVDQLVFLVYYYYIGYIFTMLFLVRAGLECMPKEMSIKIQGRIGDIRTENREPAKIYINCHFLALTYFLFVCLSWSLKRLWRKSELKKMQVNVTYS